jgi:hypothetical protein
MQLVYPRSRAGILNVSDIASGGAQLRRCQNGKKARLAIQMCLVGIARPQSQLGQAEFPVGARSQKGLEPQHALQELRPVANA